MSQVLTPPGEPRRVAYLYLLPALSVFALFVLAPLAHSMWLSLFEWDGVTPGTWVGLDNYGQVVSDPELRAAFGHSLVLVGFYAVLPVVIGLVLAAAMSRARVRGLAGASTRRAPAAPPRRPHRRRPSCPATPARAPKRWTGR